MVGNAFRVQSYSRGFVRGFLVDMHAIDELFLRYMLVNVDFLVVEFGDSLSFTEQPLRVDGGRLDQQFGDSLLGAGRQVYVDPVAEAGKGNADGDGGRAQTPQAHARHAHGGELVVRGQPPVHQEYRSEEPPRDGEHQGERNYLEDEFHDNAEGGSAFHQKRSQFLEQVSQQKQGAQGHYPQDCHPQ